MRLVSHARPARGGGARVQSSRLRCSAAAPGGRRPRKRAWAEATAAASALRRYSPADGEPRRGSRFPAEPGAEAPPLPRALPPRPGDDRRRRRRHRRAVRRRRSSDNFFEALYPWPERITAVGHTELDRFAAAFPEVTVGAGRRARAAVRRSASSTSASRTPSIEHVAGGRDEQRRFVAELCRVAERVFVTTPNRLVPDRPALAAAVRPLAPRRRPAPPRPPRPRVRRRARPARPRRARLALPVPGEDRRPRDDARRRRARMKRPVWILHVFVVGLALHNFVDGRAVRRRRPRQRARRRLGVEGGAARASGSCSSCRAAGRLRFRPALGRLARARLRRHRASSTALIPQHVARRRRDPPRRPPRRPPRPASCRRVLLRPRARPDGARRRGASARRSSRRPPPSPPSAWSTSTRSRSRGGAARARRAGSRNQLGFGYTGLSGLPENFVYNTGQRAPAPPARLDLPLAARELVHARDRAPALRRVAAAGTRRGSLSGCRRRRSLFAGLLWTHSRSSYIALALGLVVFAAAPARSGGSASSARRRPGGRRRLRLREGLPAHRARRRASPEAELKQQRQHAHSQAGGPAVSAGGLEDASTSSHLRSLRDGHRDRAPAPAGLRPRQRRLDRRADERQDQGRRVDLHRARGRRGPPRRAPLRRLVARPALAPRPLQRLARRDDGRDARARAPDRHDRRPVDRLRPVAAGRLAHVPSRQPDRKSVLRRADSCLRWTGCGSRSRTSPSHCSCLALIALSFVRFGGTAAPAVLASPTLTPGSLNPDVTQATLGDDDLRSRLDRRPSARRRTTRAAQGRADAALRRDRLAVGLPGGPPDQPRARRQPDRPGQPLARAATRGRPRSTGSRTS